MNSFRNTFAAFITLLISSLFLVVPASAQMTGGHMQSRMQPSDSSYSGGMGSMTGGQNQQAEHQGMMNSQSVRSMNRADIVNNVLAQVGSMSRQYADLESHFKSMMQISNADTLRQAMRHHMDMMQQLQQHMSSDMSMWRHMQAMMQSDSLQSDTHSAVRTEQADKHGHGD